MTITNQTVSEAYVGDGIDTEFAITQNIVENTEIVVILRDADGVETILVETVDFDYLFNTDDEGDPLPAYAVDLYVAPAVGETLTLVRRNPITQEADYVPNGPFPAEQHEAVLDRITRIMQEINEKIRRIPQFKVTADNGYDLVLPDPDTDTVWTFDENGDIEFIPISSFGEGPAGPTGPEGPAGPTGPEGPQGPAGDSDIINYISNGNAEVDTTGWIVNGTGTLALTRSTTSPLRAPAMFSMTKGAANEAGDSVSYAFTIDRADLAQVLNISFDYKTSGGFAYNGGSFESPSDIRVFISDVTNGVSIFPSQSFLDGSGKYLAQFQTDATSTSYALIFEVGTFNASAWTFDFDNVTVGPSQIATGAVVSDWISYTPTGSWVSNTTYTGLYRRIGDTLEARIKLTLSGAPTNADLTVNLPSGFSIDTAKMNSTTTAVPLIGSVRFRDTGTSGFAGHVYYNSATSVTARYFNGTGGTNPISDISPTSTTAPFTFANTDEVYLNFSVPIVGWSSNVVVSSDYGNRVIVVEASGTITGSLSEASATIWGTENRDTTGSYNPATGSFTVPETGDYEFNASVGVSGTEANDNLLDLIPYVDGSSLGRFIGRTRVMNSGLSNVQVQTSGCTFLIAGQVLTFRTNTNITGAAFANIGALSIRKVQSPQTLAGNTVVAFRGTNAAGTSMSTSTTLIPLTAVFDTHAGYNAGTSTWTCSEPGLYQMNGQLACQSAVVGTGVYFRAYIEVNGTSVAQDRTFGTGAGDVLYVNCSTLLKLASGDTVTLSGGPETGTLSLDTTATNNFLTIHKVN